MSIEVEAIYEDGVLKPDAPLPLAAGERVTVEVRERRSNIRQSAGLISLPREGGVLEYLLGPENTPWQQ